MSGERQARPEKGKRATGKQRGSSIREKPVSAFICGLSACFAYTEGKSRGRDAERDKWFVTPREENPKKGETAGPQEGKTSLLDRDRLGGIALSKQPVGRWERTIVGWGG